MATVNTWFSAMPAPTDRKAIAPGPRRRDPARLAHLIELYESRFYRCLLCLTGRRETAEDLFQETWIRVLDRGNQYRDSGSFEAWLFAIARHLVIDLSRRAKADSLD